MTLHIAPEAPAIVRSGLDQSSAWVLFDMPPNVSVRRGPLGDMTVRGPATFRRTLEVDLYGMIVSDRAALRLIGRHITRRAATGDATTVTIPMSLLRERRRPVILRENDDNTPDPEAVIQLARQGVKLLVTHSAMSADAIEEWCNIPGAADKISDSMRPLEASCDALSWAVVDAQGVVGALNNTLRVGKYVLL